jgi:CheY-like chemotaxis protein
MSKREDDMNQEKMKSILVVEDDFASRQYLLLLLKKLHFDSVAAETGEQALEIMKDRTVDMMLLDIALGPGISGLELGAQLKQKREFSKTPMVAVTAFTKDKLSSLEESGFSDYMSKPYTIDQLKEMLEKHLR